MAKINLEIEQQKVTYLEKKKKQDVLKHSIQGMKDQMNGPVQQKSSHEGGKTMNDLAHTVD